MFTISTEEQPAQVTTSQLTNAGIRRDFVYALDSVHANDSRRECDRCGGRNLGQQIYRDPQGLWVWHPECFAKELEIRRTRGVWKIRSLGWSAPQ